MVNTIMNTGQIFKKSSYLEFSDLSCCCFVYPMSSFVYIFFVIVIGESTKTVVGQSFQNHQDIIVLDLDVLHNVISPQVLVVVHRRRCRLLRSIYLSLEKQNRESFFWNFRNNALIQHWIRQLLIVRGLCSPVRRPLAIHRLPRVNDTLECVTNELHSLYPAKPSSTVVVVGNCFLLINHMRGRRVLKSFERRDNGRVGVHFEESQKRTGLNAWLLSIDTKRGT